jgi:hypothetical protein
MVNNRGNATSHAISQRIPTGIEQEQFCYFPYTQAVFAIRHPLTTVLHSMYDGTSYNPKVRWKNAKWGLQPLPTFYVISKLSSVVTVPGRVSFFFFLEIFSWWSKWATLRMRSVRPLGMSLTSFHIDPHHYFMRETGQPVSRRHLLQPSPRLVRKTRRVCLSSS